MKIYARDGIVQPASFFKFVFVGVLIGEGLIVAVFFLPFLLLAFAGMPVETTGSREALWLIPIMLPLIVFMHALMFGGMITLGLWLYSRWGKLEIAEGP